MRLTGMTACLRAGQRVLATIGDLFFSRWGSRAPRPLLTTLILWLLVVAAGLALDRQFFLPYRQPLLNDQHAMISLEMAIHQQRFGYLSHIYRKTSFADMLNAPPARLAYIFTMLPDNPDMLPQRLLDLPERCNPSTGDYVHNLMPFVNNENSVMLIDRAILRVMPDITLAGMIQAHMVLKAACLAIFVLFLLRVGFSPLLSLGAFHVALILVHTVNQERPISIYPFLLPVLLLLVALFGLTLSFGLHRRLWQHAPAMLAIGFVGAFLTNLRSSYFPVTVALALGYVVIVSLDLRRILNGSLLKTGLAAVLALACFFAGSKAFKAAFISPLEKAARDQDQALGAPLAYHVIAHPLVLFLDVPHNDLTQREGIIYDDSCGTPLAQRIDPKVTYMSANYDKALFVYYFKLWMYHPTEMARLYRLKFKTAADSVTMANPDPGKNTTKMFAVLSSPLRKRASWQLYLGLFAALAIAPLFLIRLLTPARAFALSALATVGLLLYLEMGIIESVFCWHYSAALYFWIIFAGMFSYQSLADATLYAGQWCWQKLWNRRQPSMSTTTPSDLRMVA